MTSAEIFTGREAEGASTGKDKGRTLLTSTLCKLGSSIGKIELMLLLVVALLNGIFGLALLRNRAFVTSTLWEFFWQLGDTMSHYVGQIVSAAGFIWAAWGGARRLWRHRIPAPKEVLQRVIPALLAQLVTRRVVWLGIALLALSLSAFAVNLFLVQRPFLPPGAGLVVTPDRPYDRSDSYDKFLYVADTDAGKISVGTRDARWIPEEILPIGIGEKMRGKPTCIALSPSRSEIYVVDAAADRVVVIDRLRQQTVIPVGRNPRCIVVTADEKKAYVSNAQPIPQGSISVISLDEKPHKVVHTITGVNCPVGLAVTPDGRRLYVASQCGGGHDPVFVVDTATDKMVTTIPDVAVGLTPAISPDGRRAYVIRGDPPRISIFDTRDGRTLESLVFNQPVSAMAFTADGRFLLAGVGETLKVIAIEPKTSLHRDVGSVDLGESPAAIATSGNTRIYAWLPQSRRPLRTFQMGIAGFGEARLTER